MTDIIRHRGPGDEGFAFFRDGQVHTSGGDDTPDICYQSRYPYSPKTHIDKFNASNISNTYLALGHRRLAIIDVSSAGHQPMCSSDQTKWIVYNGEIYNYIELRRELETLGYHFVSGTDTEVLLAAYDAWGVSCLDKLNGMFAFVIYDQPKNRIFVARDRFGVKPLYYWVSKQGIAFASEIKQFTQLPGWEAKTNGQRAFEFLNWGILDHSSETLFHGVYQLRGGEAMQLCLSDIRSSKMRYLPNTRLPVTTWYKVEQKNHFPGSFAEAIDEFLAIFTDAIRLRLRAYTLKQ